MKTRPRLSTPEFAHSCGCSANHRSRDIPEHWRRPRRSLIVCSRCGPVVEDSARALAESLETMGIEALFAGSLESPQQIASIVAEQRADTVELYLGGAGGVLLLRELLRELIEVGRRDVSIVVHRVEKLTRPGNVLRVLTEQHHGSLERPALATSSGYSNLPETPR